MHCHWWSIHMGPQVVWSRQLSGASLDLSHSDLVRYRCYTYRRKSVGAHPAHLQIWVLLLRRAYTWYMVCLCVRAYVAMRVSAQSQHYFKTIVTMSGCVTICTRSKTSDLSTSSRNFDSPGILMNSLSTCTSGKRWRDTGQHSNTAQNLLQLVHVHEHAYAFPVQ